MDKSAKDKCPKCFSYGWFGKSCSHCGYNKEEHWVSNQNNSESHIILTCINSACRQKLRIPSESKMLKITCPKCNTSFSPEERADQCFDIGIKYYNEGNKSEALNLFKEAVLLRGDEIDLHWLGSTLTDLELYQEALPILLKVLDVSEEISWTDYHWIGTTYFRLECYEEALSYLKKSEPLLIKQEIDEEEWIKECLKMEKRYYTPKETLDETIDLKRSAIKSSKQANNYWLAKTLIKLERYNEAMGYCHDALKLLQNETTEYKEECEQLFDLCKIKISKKKD